MPRPGRWSPSYRDSWADDGSCLEDLCGGDLDALARAVAHIDDRDVPASYRDTIKTRVAVVRRAKLARLAAGCVGTDHGAAELDAAFSPAAED
jgi:hypothetical protein